MFKPSPAMICALSLAACATPGATPPGATLAAAPRVALAPPAPHDKPTFVPRRALSAAEVQAIASEFPGGIVTEAGVRIGVMTYRSTLGGRAIPASALVALPEPGRKVRGIILHLRGSDVPRAEAPTSPTANWTDVAAVYAGSGFALVVPDYIGFGASPSPQAFLLLEENLVDFRAALTAARGPLDLGERAPLHILGFSQGAQLAAAMHQDLERRPLAGFDLRATVAVAGPHELVGQLRRRLLPPTSRDPIAIGYLAWAAYTYAWRSGRPLETVFQPRFVPLVARWFGGDMTAPEIVAEAPGDVRDLLTEDFRRGLMNDPDHWFVAMLRRNETLELTPRAPLRIVVGGGDEHVDPPATRALHERAKARGGAVGIVEHPGLSHHQTGAIAFSSSIEWFKARAEGRNAPP
jgi:alpha-beta hydrolase superfamily lysophospholipase